MKILEFMATLGLDTSEFETKMKNAGKTGETVALNVSKKSALATIVSGNLLTDVVRKSTQALAEIAKTGISYNATLEQYAANFEVLLGSSEAAEAKIAELKELDMTSPFGLDQLAYATEQMLQYGMSAEESSEMLRRLGDISLGDTSKLSGLALAFSQVQGNGRLMGQELNQLVQHGFNPLQEISKLTGASIGDLRAIMAGQNASDQFAEQLSEARAEVEALGDGASEGAKMLVQIGDDGYISAEMVTNAFRLATDEGGRFYKGMETANNTFNGQMGNLKASLKNLAGQVFKPAFDWLSENALPAAIDATNKLSKGFEEGGSAGMMKAANAIIDELGLSMTQKAAEAFPGFVNDIVETINTAFGTNLPKMSDFELMDQADAEKKIATWWSGIKAAIGSLILPVSLPGSILNYDTVLSATPEKDSGGGGGERFSSDRRFATGLDYVPYNEFPARLHEGEAVLTKLEASNWREGRLRSSSGGGETVNVVVNLDNVSIRDERDIETLAQQIAQYTRRQNYGMGAVSY